MGGLWGGAGPGLQPGGLQALPLGLVHLHSVLGRRQEDQRVPHRRRLPAQTHAAAFQPPQGDTSQADLITTNA